jgi:hypothetical protein
MAPMSLRELGMSVTFAPLDLRGNELLSVEGFDWECYLQVFQGILICIVSST